MKKLAFAVLVAATVAVPVFASVDEAEAKFAAYEQAQAKFDAQLAQGVQEGLGELQQEAQTLVREAQKLYLSGGAANSRSREVLTGYAAALRATRDFDLSGEVLARAATLFPEDVTLWRQLGEDLGKVGPAKRSEAYQALRRAIALDGESSEAAQSYFIRGRLNHEDGLYELAREDYQAAQAADDGHVGAKLGNALLDARDGDVIQASATIDALGAAAQPHDVWTRVTLRESLYDYERLQKFFPDTAENHSAYARLMYRAARIPDAVLAARHAVTLDSEDFESWNLIGAMQIQLGVLSSARDAYEKSLAINPNQPRIQATLERLPKE